MLTLSFKAENGCVFLVFPTMVQSGRLQEAEGRLPTNPDISEERVATNSIRKVRGRPAPKIDDRTRAAPAQSVDWSVPTIHDVASRANVSLITVSRALKTPSLLAPDTLRRVEAAVAETGYIPNLIAGGLRSARTRLVTALVPTLMGQLFAEMIGALTETLAANGYQLMLGQVGYAAESREDDLVRAIIGRRPDGIVITGVMHTKAVRQLLTNSRIPVVETWDYTAKPVDMLVGLSHEKLGAEVCKFLASRGRRRLAVVSGDDRRAANRLNGFLKTAARLGLRAPVVHLVPAPTTHASGRAGLSAVLAADPAIDAVFCSSDMQAMGVLTEARARGLDVPKSLAVIGLGDIDFSATLEPSLSTVRIDGAQMGSTAARLIVDRLAGREIQQKVVDLGFSIVERQST
jgi:LacI family gluconate utilization system Gnt-I transcriptional repressor